MIKLPIDYRSLSNRSCSDDRPNDISCSCCYYHCMARGQSSLGFGTYSSTSRRSCFQIPKSSRKTMIPLWDCDKVLYHSCSLADSWTLLLTITALCVYVALRTWSITSVTSCFGLCPTTRNATCHWAWTIGPPCCPRSFNYKKIIY